MRIEVFLCMLVAAPAAANPAFETVTVPHHAYEGGWEHFVGGGVAAFDCSGDGLPELFAAGGSNPARLFLNRSDVDTVVFDVASVPQLEQTGVIGAYPLDIDSDGILDLAILRVGENQLMQGLGDCQFAPFDGLGFHSGEHWTTAFSATWEVGANLPTLAFGNYVDRDAPDGPFGTCDTNFLYRPQGHTYGEPTQLDPGFCPLSMLFTDWGRSGRADLRVSNDRHYYVRGGEEQMWAMEPAPRLYGPQDGWNSHQLWGMGIAARDLDGDGLAEVMLTSMGDQRLQALDPDADGPSFVDERFERGATAHRPYTGGDGRPSTGWHAAFGDVDNDGLADLFITKGNVEQMPGSAMNDPNNLLIGQPDGTFAEAGLEAGVASIHRSRGGAVVDLNGDGLLDIVVVNRHEPMEVYRNVSAETGTWLAVDLSQPGANSLAVGAFVEVRAADRLWTQEVTVGGGHAGGVAGALHFGLGPVDQVDIRVIWPDGTVQDWPAINTNQRLTISPT